MAHIIFYPKEGIKILITEEPSDNFPLQFTARRVSNNQYQFRCHLNDTAEVAEVLKMQNKPGSLHYKYFNYDTEIFSCAAWTESLTSVIRSHKFFKPMLYWYLIS